MSRRRRHRRSRASGRFTLVGAILIALIVITGTLLASIPQAAWPIVLVLTSGLVGIGIWVSVSRRRRARRARLAHLQTLGDLLVLTPAEFEEAVADLFRQLGYRNVTRTGRAGDLTADIVARDPDGRSVVIQCKRYAPGSQVGSPDIQRFIGMLITQHKADQGIFVTTAAFSRPARELAHGKALELIDGPALTARLAQVAA
jgi:restriction system protein